MNQAAHVAQAVIRSHQVKDGELKKINIKNKNKRKKKPS